MTVVEPAITQPSSTIVARTQCATQSDGNPTLQVSDANGDGSFVGPTYEMGVVGSAGGDGAVSEFTTTFALPYWMGPGSWLIVVHCPSSPQPSVPELIVDATENWDLWKPTLVTVNGVSTPGSVITMHDGDVISVDAVCPAGAAVQGGRVVLWAFSDDYTQQRHSPYVSTEYPATEFSAEGFTSMIEVRSTDFTAPTHYAEYFVAPICEATTPGFDPGVDVEHTDQLIRLIPAWDT